MIEVCSSGLHVLRALEHHVLEQVREAGAPRPLVLRAHVIPERARGRSASSDPPTGSRAARSAASSSGTEASAAERRATASARRGQCHGQQQRQRRDAMRHTRRQAPQNDRITMQSSPWDYMLHRVAATSCTRITDLQTETRPSPTAGRQTRADTGRFAARRPRIARRPRRALRSHAAFPASARLSAAIATPVDAETSHAARRDHRDPGLQRDTGRATPPSISHW